MNWQQFLTERVLGECWHEWIKRPEVGLQAKCSCGMLYDVTSYNRADILYIHRNRTFDNRNDLLDLYEAIYRDGKWKEFETEIFERAFIPYYYKEAKAINNFNAWLFCLSSEGYEDRCKMAAEFYGWEADHD